MKRGGDQLTGGSRDVNPQLMTVDLIQTANDTATVVQLNLPIPRLPTKQGKNLVIELLWIEYFFLGWNTAPGSTSQTLVTVTTSPAIGTSIRNALNDPRIIDAWFRLFANATSAGFQDVAVSHESQLTDEAGHGLLIATDSLYFGLYSTGTLSTNNMVLKLAYRWKEVSLVEYIGIVQSQQ